MRESVIERAVRLPQAAIVVEEGVGTDLRILVPALMLVAVGVAMVFSAGMPIAITHESRDILFYLKRELIFCAAGIIAMVWASRRPLEWIEAKAGVIYAAVLLLLLGVHVLGKTVNGARSWYNIPGIGLSFQPSEAAKLALVIALARYFARFPNGLRQWKHLAPPVLMMGLYCVSILKEPDMGTVAVIGLAMLIFFHMGGAKLSHLGAFAGAAAAVAGAKIAREPYQLQRIVDWLLGGPERALAGNYQMNRALLALGSGGLTGCGYCGSIEKYFYLPEATTDAILAVLGEELGLIATWAVVGLFAYLVWQGLRVAARAEDRFSGLVAAGITCVFGVQALMNIAVVTGAAPTTGVTLPFVSYGGSSLLFSLMGVGLLLNVSRNSRARSPAYAGGARR
jgi:cell division protein FtsW